MQCDCRAPKQRAATQLQSEERRGNPPSTANMLRTFPKTQTLHSLSYVRTTDDVMEKVLLPVTLDPTPMILSYHRYEGLVDTGATFTIVTAKVAKKRGFQVKPFTGYRLVAPCDETEIKVLGQTDLLIS